MMASITFVLERGTRTASVLKVVEAGRHAQREARRSYREHLLDTFDWRVFKNGRRLSAVSNDAHATLHLTSQTARIECRLASAALPAFLGDLPSRQMQELLSVIEARRLLSRVTVQVEEQPVRLFDGEGHATARLRILRCRAVDPTGKARARKLPVMLRLESDDGYEDSHRALASRLEAELGLVRTEQSLLDTALHAVGVEPGGYAAKVTLALDPQTRADQALIAIHTTLLDTVRANEDGVRRNLDAEFLHDLRVAVRRIRAAMAQLQGVLPKADTARFSAEFKWLGGVTGPVRDLDVYLHNIAEYRADLPQAVRGDLDPLAAYLRAHHRTEHRRLVRRLASKRYKRLTREWQMYLEQGPHDGPDAPDATRPILDVASERIWAVYRRVYKRGRRVAADTPAKVLHKLRIDCKKLRYLLEFFSSLYPAREIGELIESLRRLQDNLGGYNDLEVQQLTLVRFAHEMAKEDLASVGSLLAMGRLVEHLQQRQVAERQRFAECWGSFATGANRQRFRQLFKRRAMVAPQTR